MNKTDSQRAEGKEQGSRLREITAVLHKNNISRGVTPEKLRIILEELGPTYVKIGQIMSMHSDILPQRYCDELMHLRSEVAPMSFEQVVQVIEESYGYSWKDVFTSIEAEPIGSASIAQVHRAVLRSGEQVVIKVQRQGIYEVMSRDIALLHKAVRLLPSAVHRGLVDLDMVLDELWEVTKDEMNFLMEASHMEEFEKYNRNVAFVGTPVLYREFSTMHVLVMEYIDGFSIDEKEGLVENGYDLKEIGSKLVDHYMKQVMEDGFFHADPHSGNVKIRDGKIVWIDLGMMGRLTETDKRMITRAVQGIAENDINEIQDAVLALGEFRGKPDQGQLHEDLKHLVNKYGSVELGMIKIAEIMQDLMEVMKENKISMPHGLTMLVRGLTHVEGILSDISPEINMIEIAQARIMSSMFHNFDWKKEVREKGKLLYRAANKTARIPMLMDEILQGYLRGQTKIHLDLHASKELSSLLRRLVRNITMGLWVMALLVSSSIICTTDMKPKILGIPALGMLGYLMASAIMMYVFIRHFFSRK